MRRIGRGHGQAQGPAPTFTIQFGTDFAGLGISQYGKRRYDGEMTPRVSDYRDRE